MGTPGTYTAIPTLYKGVQFRSRLEARWAAMFDLLKWEWEYEPIDFPGWIPDFVLKGKKPNGEPTEILVEVKPVTSYPSEVGEKCLDAIGTIERERVYIESDTGHEIAECYHVAPFEILILGRAVPVAMEDNMASPTDDCAFGWLIEPQGGAGDAILTRQEQGWGFCHGFGSWHDRISGEYDGNLHACAEGALHSLWVQAGNLTQWKGVQYRGK